MIDEDNDGLIFSVRRLLLLLDFGVSNKFLLKLRHHPDYPSLLTMSKTFTGVGCWK